MPYTAEPFTFEGMSRRGTSVPMMRYGADTHCTSLGFIVAATVVSEAYDHDRPDESCTTEPSSARSSLTGTLCTLLAAQMSFWRVVAPRVRR
jgi:hypothetical protein